MPDPRPLTPVMLLLILTATAAIFVFDVLTPRGIAAGGLYAIVVIMTMWPMRRELTVAVAALSSVLVVVATVLSSGELTLMVVINRAIAAGTIWIVAALVMMHERDTRAVRERDARLRLFLNEVPALIWMADREMRLTHAQGRGLEGRDVRAEALVGKEVSAVWGGEAGRQTVDAHRRALNGEACHHELIERERVLQLHVEPVYGVRGDVVGCVTLVLDVTERKAMERERERVIVELREAVESIKTLRGLLPICASCKKIRNDRGYWDQIEVYIERHSQAQFTHGLCPDCLVKLYHIT